MQRNPQTGRVEPCAELVEQTAPARWTLKRLVAWIESQFGCRVSRETVRQALKRLGLTYLQLGLTDSMIRMAKEKEDLAQKNLEYVKTRAGLGQGAQLDVRIAETKINMARTEAEKMRTTKSVLLDEMKFIMGIPFDQ